MRARERTAHEIKFSIALLASAASRRRGKYVRPDGLLARHVDGVMLFDSRCDRTIGLLLYWFFPHASGGVSSECL